LDYFIDNVLNSCNQLSTSLSCSKLDVINEEVCVWDGSSCDGIDIDEITCDANIDKSCQFISRIVPGGCAVIEDVCMEPHELCSSYTEYGGITCRNSNSKTGNCYYNSSSGECVNPTSNNICSDIIV
jgi:hypothetical protein